MLHSSSYIDLGNLIRTPCHPDPAPTFDWARLEEIVRQAVREVMAERKEYEVHHVKP